MYEVVYHHLGDGYHHAESVVIVSEVLMITWCLCIKAWCGAAG
jgi:hypothetical protein